MAESVSHEKSVEKNIHNVDRKHMDQKVDCGECSHSSFTQ